MKFGSFQNEITGFLELEIESLFESNFAFMDFGYYGMTF